MKPARSAFHDSLARRHTGFWVRFAPTAWRLLDRPDLDEECPPWVKEGQEVESANGKLRATIESIETGGRNFTGQLETRVWLTWPISADAPQGPRAWSLNGMCGPNLYEYWRPV